MARSRSRGAGGARGIVAATLLALAALGIAWLCVRATLLRTLPPTSPDILAIAPDDPTGVLTRAADALVRQRGILSPATLAGVERAAAAAPLDARAFLVLGHQRLLDGEAERAVRTLEAGQRLDPRQRLIHLLLLDRYLRTGRYADAATQMSLLSRLLGGTQAPVATAMAQMLLDPRTREGVRRTLAGDPRLERSVLTALARSNTPPAALFALAGPVALADAQNSESWGPVLVARLVAAGRFAEARAVWARVFRLAPAEAAAPIFDAALRERSASPPFNWTLVADSLGAADIRGGGLAVDYYGRDSGVLASQLLVLGPGRYRFAFTVDAGQSDNAARLGWTIACATGAKPVLATARIVAGAARRRLAADFVVPVGCPAQLLSLGGEAGDLPAPATVTVRDLDLHAVGGAAS